MPDPKLEPAVPAPGNQPNEREAFRAADERENIRRKGELLDDLAKHWAYLGDLPGNGNSREFWKAKHRLQRLCGVKEADDEPDFVQSMQGRSLKSLEKSIDAAIKAMQDYEKRHSTFFGFLARLFNKLSGARMEDTDRALGTLQEMKKSVVRLRLHGEELNPASANKRTQKNKEKGLSEKSAAKNTPQSEKVVAAKAAEELNDEPVKQLLEVEEAKFQNMKPEERVTYKEKVAEGEFYKNYAEFCRNHPDRVDDINSNDLATLRTLRKDFGKTDAQLNSYLNRRIQNLKKISELTQNSDENFQRNQTLEPLIEKDDHKITTKIMLQDVKQLQMQHTRRGCWAVALSSMLQQKGIEIDQETIRSFRPDKRSCSQEDLVCANGDYYNSIDTYRGLIFQVLPETALNSAHAMSLNVGTDDGLQPWTQQEKMGKRETFKNSLRAVIKRGLETDKGTLALLMKDHYQTIYGYEKVIEEGQEKEYVYLHDPNDPAKTKLSLDELAEEGYKISKNPSNADQILSEQYSFEAHWLQNLTNDKGELALDDALKAKGVSYKEHKLECGQLSKMQENSYEGANWRMLSNSMDPDVTIDTYLPVEVKNLEKNRIREPIDLTTRERRNTLTRQNRKLQLEKPDFELLPSIKSKSKDSFSKSKNPFSKGF